MVACAAAARSAADAALADAGLVGRWAGADVVDAGDSPSEARAVAGAPLAPATAVPKAVAVAATESPNLGATRGEEPAATTSRTALALEGRMLRPTRGAPPVSGAAR